MIVAYVSCLLVLAGTDLASGYVTCFANQLMYALDSNNINRLYYQDNTSNLIKVDRTYECECMCLLVAVLLSVWCHYRLF